MATLNTVYSELRKLYTLAKNNGVRIAVDAEQSWFQPCIDRMVEHLSREFNRQDIPIVYNTYQTNLRHTEEAIRRDLAQANKEGKRLSSDLIHAQSAEIPDS